MKKKFEYLVVELENGKYILRDVTGKVRTDIYVRDIMCQHCIDNNQCIQYDIETGRSYRKDMNMFSDMEPKEIEVKAKSKIESDPILNFIPMDFNFFNNFMLDLYSCHLWMLI